MLLRSHFSSPRRLAVPLLFLSLAASAAAQLGPPASPSPVTISESSGKRVKGLTYDGSTSPGQQDVLFTFTVDPDAGYTSIVWSVDGTAIASAQNSKTCPYLAVGVGKHEVDVKVGYPGQPVHTGALTFAAIGGPLTTGITSGERYTPTTDLLAGGSGSAKYLQYFGFDPSGDIPDGAQPPQMGTLAPALPQLDPGTAYSWSTIGNVSIVGSSTNASVTVGANDQSGYGADGARLTFTYTDPNDTTLSGSAQDDSDQTPPPGETSTDPSFYRFTGHKPSDIVNFSKTNLSTTVGPPSWAIADIYRLQVFDQLGLYGAGVWVQERFPDAPPGGYSGVNADGVHWTTDPSGLLLDGATYNIAYDELAISLDEPYPFADNVQAYMVRVQKYYGGTSSTSISGSGVYLGTFNCNFWTDQTQHNPVNG